MRKQWETTTVIVDTQTERDYQPKFDKAMNALGQEGWELVSVVRDMNKLIGYMKREKRLM